jgi:hypothetical protein
MVEGALAKAPTTAPATAISRRLIDSVESARLAAWPFIAHLAWISSSWHAKSNLAPQSARLEEHWSEQMSGAIPATPSGHQAERDQWRQVEQEDSYLVDGKAGVMDCVECLDRKLEPAAMHSVHPVMSEDKGAEPDE